jgi:hypothetical protein
MNLSASLHPMATSEDERLVAGRALEATGWTRLRARAILRRRASAWQLAVLFLIAPNLPPLLATHWLGALPHGYLNIEFLLIGAVGCFLPRRLVFLLLIVESLADMAYAICWAYQFSLADLLDSVLYMPVLPKLMVLVGFVFLGFVLAVCLLLAGIRPCAGKRLQTVGVLLLLVAALVPIDVLSGQNPVWGSDLALIRFRVARSPVLSLIWRESKARARIASVQNTAGSPMPSASGVVAALIGGLPGPSASPNSVAPDPLSPNVVLVVVESWGLLLDPQLSQALESAYDDPRIARRYRVTRGVVPFTGLTVPGEARELCHSSVGFGILHTTAEQASQCLPAFFHARGYQNISVHGYVGQMFHRADWYPRLGFDQSWFEPELARAGLPRCQGGFPGICDASIAGYIGDSSTG